MNKKFSIFLVPFLMLSLKLAAATVDTVSVYSDSMNMNIKDVVIRPSGYKSSQKYPVLYLLHGYSGNYADWIKKDPGLPGLADEYGMLIVCPDGGFASWYFDSPVVKSSRYETYISRELVTYIDKHYSTVNNRTGRAITGLSMGGHGALYLAFRHQDVFGAAGSMSGGVDLRPFPDSFGLKEVLGEYNQYPERWEEGSIVNMLYMIKSNSLALTFDCGADDFFCLYNNQLHEKLLERKIPHEYTSRPGGHSWEYWCNSIKYQAMFFSTFFNSTSKVKAG
ncbi:alpha/beta hydrolase [Arcticibacter tournemirensis]|uniref:Esterase family protein n=1 Tax=Arcticibacter tournemirensis TaxID=699437 RepID=A0A4Q0MF13_9SPHI|nr:alpha/beta hydrolase family protein [Arcticibacter tournemirensis]RXF71864.1 esterase family protein [Arcticibacter tournemirensis]